VIFEKMSPSMTPKRHFVYPDAGELTLVIRGAGERTLGSCVSSFARQLPALSQQMVLDESPFSVAVRRTLEIGIQAQRPWLIAVDADIIPLDDVVVRIREICGKMDPRAFVATPLFLCQGVGGLATRGLHCYRASLLPEALTLLDTLPDDLRPESRIHDAMGLRGYTRECYAKVLGIHEYEQYFKHIYLKAMLRSRKDEFRDQIRSALETRAPFSHDCQVALWGFMDASTSTDQPIEYDWNAPYPKLEERMEKMGLKEKTPMNTHEFEGRARELIATHDFVNDTQTLPWIREILRFEHGGSEVLSTLDSAPNLTRAVPSIIG